MKRLIDEKGRLFGKLSVIDLAVLLLVLVIAAGTLLRGSAMEQAEITVDTVPVRYTLEITGVRDWAANNFRAGDELFTLQTNVGTVVRVEAHPHVAVSSEGSEPWWSEVPNRYVLFLEVEATATVIDGRVLVSRTIPLSVGNSPNTFMSRYAEAQATVREIVLYD